MEDILILEEFDSLEYLEKERDSGIQGHDRRMEM